MNRGQLRAALAEVDGHLAAAEAAMMSDAVLTAGPWERGETLAWAHTSALMSVASGLAGIVRHLAADDTEPGLDEPGADELGSGAYRAYALVVGGLNHRGDAMPRWEQLPETTRRAWSTAALWARR